MAHRLHQHQMAYERPNCGNQSWNRAGAGNVGGLAGEVPQAAPAMMSATAKASCCFTEGTVKDTVAKTEQPITLALARRSGENTLVAALSAVSSLATLSLPGSSVPMRNGELRVVSATVASKVAQVTGFMQQLRDLM